MVNFVFVLSSPLNMCVVGKLVLFMLNNKIECLCKYWNGWNAKKGEGLNWLVKKYVDF